MSELVKALRSPQYEHAGTAAPRLDAYLTVRIMNEAAARIEALEAALRDVAAEAQQPIAWRIYKSKGDGVCWQEITASHTVAKRKKAEGYFVDPLYLGVAQADRIEALEAALVEISCLFDSPIETAVRIAQAALAPETEK